MGEVDHVLGLLKRRRDAAAAAQDMELVAKALVSDQSWSRHCTASLAELHCNHLLTLAAWNSLVETAW
jgi:hypothetical protein